MPKFNLPEGSPLPPPPRMPREPDMLHGGSWKVAYADFVTALMSLFIVLWMMNSGDRVKASVSGYFRDPRGYTQKLGAGPGGSVAGSQVRSDSVHEARNQIESALHNMPKFDSIATNVKLSVTGEGLLIDLLETEQGTFFQSGSSAPTAAAESLLSTLGREIGRLPNTIIIEGHTDAKVFRNAGPTVGYSNWELAADRANAARRLLNANGLREGQIVEIRGFADQHLFNEKDPNDPRNRRVSIVVKFN